MTLYMRWITWFHKRVGWFGERFPEAGPADVILMAYVAFTGLIILFMGWKLDSPGLWAALVVAHAAILVITWLVTRLSRPGPGLGGFARDLYPLLYIVFLYWELRYLALFFSVGYNDGLILAAEEFLFGEQLAMTLSQRFPQMWISEILHFFYAFYWVIVPLAGGAMYLRGKVEGFRELVFSLVVVFFSCYMFFIFFPVQGPHYEFPPIGEPWSNGFFYQMVHAVLEDGGSKGAAFPSSHVAVACTILPVAWRHDRPVFWAFLIPVVGLTISTVYGRFHYGVDALAGVLLVVVLFPLIMKLRTRLTWYTAGEPARA